MFRIFPRVSASIPQVRMRQFMGDDPADEILRAAAKGPFEHHTTAGASARWRTQWDVRRRIGRLVIEEHEPGIAQEIMADVLRQRRDHVRHVNPQEWFEPKRGDPGFHGGGAHASIVRGQGRP